MKLFRYILPLVAIAAISACSKGDIYDDSSVGGRTDYYNRNGRSYMMGCADNLITDALDQLEMALEVNARGGSVSSHFNMNGDITANGTVWTVTEYGSRLEGMKIKKNSDLSWTLTFDGDYSIDSETYPTHFSFHVMQEAHNAGYHYNWKVNIISGERVEREGYSCQVSTPVPLQYQVGVGSQESIKGWNMMYGTLMMSVFKSGTLVDLCELVFNGVPYNAKYTRGL